MDRQKSRNDISRPWPGGGTSRGRRRRLAVRAAWSGVRPPTIALLAPALTLALALATTAGVAQAEEITPPVNTAAPTISREGEEGAPTPAVEEGRLTASTGSWSGTAPITYTYQWLSCTPEGEGCAAIEGATGSTFTPTASYLGRALEVEVTASNAAGSSPPATARTSEVRASGGDVVAFGQNTHSELGAGYRDNYEDQPVPVINLTNVTAVVAGDEFSLALLDNGTVRSWGDDDFGQLGDGENGRTGENWTKLTNYVTVTGLTGVKTIASANDHVLALLENGTVETWGNNFYGQLGNGTYGDSTSHPTAVPDLTKVLAIAAGGASDYALLSNHTVMAWGENGNGQLAIGETGPLENCHNKKKLCSPVPHEVGTPVRNEKGEIVKNEKGEPELTPLTNVAAISAGEDAAYALLEDGRVLAWGANTEGQLGNGAKETLHVNLTPTEVKTRSGEPLEDVETVSGGEDYALALLKSGDVYGWGRVGKGGQLGEVEETEVCSKERACVKAATQVKDLESVTAISAGEGYSLALSGGTVYGLGYNEQGELGDGNTANTTRPEPVRAIGGVDEISAGVGQSGVPHSLALLQSGVQPPATLLSIEPAPHSLKLAWNLTSSEYEVKDKVWNPEECEEESVEPGGGLEGEVEEPPTEECKPPSGKWLSTFKLGAVSGYELTGLVAETPYLVHVKSHNKDDNHKVRDVIGSPLP